MSIINDDIKIAQYNNCTLVPCEGEPDAKVSNTPEPLVDGGKVKSNFAQNLSDNNISSETKNEDTCLEISCKEEEWKGIYCNINSYYKENIINNLVCVESCLTHDGYSKHGPDSNIYDIYIVHKSQDPENFIVDNWHTEYWYREDEVSFKLYQRIYSEEDFETYYRNSFPEKSPMCNQGNTYFVPWGQICY